MSQELLNLTENALNPVEIAADLRLGEDLRCPSCGGILRVLPSGFSCSGFTCKFKAGSSLDILALVHGGYTAGLDVVLDRYRSRLQFLDTMELREYRASILAAVRSKRALLDFFLRRLSEPPDTNSERAVLHAWMEDQGMSPHNCGATAFAVTKDDIAALSGICIALDAKGAFPATACLAFPFFSDHHTISEIRFLNRRGQTNRVTCFPARFTYTGLLRGDPSFKTDLCYNYVDAASLATGYSLQHTGRSIHALGFDPTQHRLGWIPEEPCYSYTPDFPDLNAPGAIYDECPRLAMRAPDGTLLKWTTFVVDTSLKVLLEYGFNAEACSLVFTSRLGMAEYARIIMGTRQAGRHDLANELERRLRDYPVYQNGTTRLYALPSGYFMANKSELRQAITNFTLELKTNLSFLGSSDLYHTGALVVQGKTYPLALRSECLEHSKDLEAAVRAAEARVPGGEATPSVIDKPNLKWVVNHLRASIAKLPKQIGVAQLGWDGYRKTYCGPYWRVEGTNVVAGPTVFHPDTDVLQNFSPTPEEITGEGPISTTVCDVIAQALAMVVRSYLGMDFFAVNVEHTAEARAMLSQLFRGLGQTEMVRLNFNSRSWGDIKGVDGFPFYAQGHSKEALKLPAFVLSDAGAQLDGELGGAPRILKDAIIKTVKWLAETSGQGFQRSVSVSPELELLREGRLLLRDVCKIADLPAETTRCATLELVLRGIPVEKVGEYFFHNLSAQKVFLDCSKLAVDITTLELEMGALTEELTRAGHFLIMDNFSGMEMLQSFYKDRAYPAAVDWIPGDSPSPAPSSARLSGM